MFQRFVAADNASEAFAGLKRIHGMMPYFMLKAALKISNPMGMIRGQCMLNICTRSKADGQLRRVGSFPRSAVWWPQPVTKVSRRELYYV